LDTFFQFLLSLPHCSLFGNVSHQRQPSLLRPNEGSLLIDVLYGVLAVSEAREIKGQRKYREAHFMPAWLDRFPKRTEEITATFILGLQKRTKKRWLPESPALIPRLYIRCVVNVCLLIIYYYLLIRCIPPSIYPLERPSQKSAPNPRPCPRSLMVSLQDGQKLYEGTLTPNLVFQFTAAAKQMPSSHHFASLCQIKVFVESSLSCFQRSN